jgi:superfamily II DNA/RNA helicase
MTSCWIILYFFLLVPDSHTFLFHGKYNAFNFDIHLSKLKHGQSMYHKKSSSAPISLLTSTLPFKVHGISKLFNFQAATLQTLQNGQSAILQSPTGSGKTIAYLTAITELLSRRNNIHNNPMEFLILVPSHVLALQIQSTILQMVFGLNHNSKQATASNEIIAFCHKNTVLCNIKSRILVGTPTDLLQSCTVTNAQGVTDTSSFCNLKFLVLDEVDQLLSTNAQDPSGSPTQQLLDIIKGATRDNIVQLVACSASIGRDILRQTKQLALSTLGIAPGKMTVIKVGLPATNSTNVSTASNSTVHPVIPKSIRHIAMVSSLGTGTRLTATKPLSPTTNTPKVLGRKKFTPGMSVQEYNKLIMRDLSVLSKLLTRFNALVPPSLHTRRGYNKTIVFVPQYDNTNGKVYERVVDIPSLVGTLRFWGVSGAIDYEDYRLRNEALEDCVRDRNTARSKANNRNTSAGPVSDVILLPEIYSRGIHIPGVDLVVILGTGINAITKGEVADYFHMAGRTGRLDSHKYNNSCAVISLTDSLGAKRLSQWLNFSSIDQTQLIVPYD